MAFRRTPATTFNAVGQHQVLDVTIHKGAANWIVITTPGMSWEGIMNELCNLR